jgi:tyrosinase
MMRVLSAAALLACVAGTSARSDVIRKDWATMTQPERTAFTDAVNAIKLNKAEMPARSYDSLVLDHREAYRTPCPWVENGEDPEGDMYYRNGDQKGPAFLPWHRQQLMLLEKALQEVSGDATMGVPYWNYMVDSFKVEPASTP